jgi:heme-degrading monooxygenase HmoA
MPLQQVETPPEDASSYVLDGMGGEIQSMPGFRGIFRFYATEKQTDNAISVFVWDDPASDQPYHYNKKTHNCFLVVEGHDEGLL